MFSQAALSFKSPGPSLSCGSFYSGCTEGGLATMIYPHQCGSGPAKAIPGGAVFAGLGFMGGRSKWGLMFYGHKQRPAPPHVPGSVMKLPKLELTVPESNIAPVGKFKPSSSDSSNEAGVAHSEPLAMLHPPEIAAGPGRGVHSPGKNNIVWKTPARKVPVVSRTGGLQRELIRTLIEGTRPKHGSVWEEGLKSDDRARAFVFSHQAACIVAPPVKPLRLGTPTARTNVHTGGTKTPRPVVAGMMREPRQKSLANGAARQSSGLREGCVVGRNGDLLKCGDLMDPTNHSEHVKMSDIVGSDHDEDTALPMDNDSFDNASEPGNSPPSPCPSLRSASSSPESTPPMTPVDLDFGFLVNCDRHIEPPRCFNEGSDLMDVDVGGAISATH